MEESSAYDHRLSFFLVGGHTPNTRICVFRGLSTKLEEGSRDKRDLKKAPILRTTSLHLCPVNRAVVSSAYTTRRILRKVV